MKNFCPIFRSLSPAGIPYLRDIRVWEMLSLVSHRSVTKVDGSAWLTKQSCQGQGPVQTTTPLQLLRVLASSFTSWEILSSPQSCYQFRWKDQCKLLHPMIIPSISFTGSYRWGWRDGSTAKSMDLSSIGPQLGSQNPNQTAPNYLWLWL